MPGVGSCSPGRWPTAPTVVGALRRPATTPSRSRASSRRARSPTCDHRCVRLRCASVPPRRGHGARRSRRPWRPPRPARRRALGRCGLRGLDGSRIRADRVCPRRGAARHRAALPWRVPHAGARPRAVRRARRGDRSRGRSLAGRAAAADALTRWDRAPVVASPGGRRRIPYGARRARSRARAGDCALRRTHGARARQLHRLGDEPARASRVHRGARGRQGRRRTRERGMRGPRRAHRGCDLRGRARGGARGSTTTSSRSTSSTAAEAPPST